MRASELDRHMRHVGTWVDWSSTVDTFKAGSPETEVRGIAVAWQSTWPAMKEAHERGCNLFVTHETTFYTPKEDDPALFTSSPAREKRAWLEETGMMVYRCHDVWDVMPEYGVLDSWAAGLGLVGPPLAAQKYYAVYTAPAGAHTVGDLARHVLDCTAAIGQDLVQFVGAADTLHRPVTRVAIGTGAITRVGIMAVLGAADGRQPDCLIVTDDGFWTSRDGCWALDAGLPLLVVNHGTAEEWGLANLARYLRSQWPEVPVHHIEQGSRVRTAAALSAPASVAG